MEEVQWPPQLFAASAIIAAVAIPGATRWLISGAAGLTYCLILGSYNGYRVFPFVGLWTLIATINLGYFLAATSWLFYWIYVGCTYPVITMVCLYQFSMVSRFVRRRLRRLLKSSHLFDDKIAYFGLPALEIDTEVDGLLVIRGVTVHISSLTLIAHGIEVGIKLSDDMELALQVDEVVIPLFRQVRVGDVYANLKGGHNEMSFGEPLQPQDPNGAPILASDTPMLRAATRRPSSFENVQEQMTNGHAPEPLKDPREAAASIQELSLDDDQAAEKYNEIIRSIRRSSTIDESEDFVETLMDSASESVEDGIVSNSTAEKFKNAVEHSVEKDKRAAICTQLHSRPTISHPPSHSVRVTTLQSVGPPWVKRLLHRMPLLYRLLLGPVAYFHPVYISSVTAGASGKWIKHMLDANVFKRQADDSETTKLENRISAWLVDANFVLEMVDMTGIAQVPIARGYDITCIMGINDTMAYRTQIQQTSLKQVVRLGGADATITVPSMLLPHHEHWLPDQPTRQDVKDQEENITVADGVPQAIRLERELEQLVKDETNVKVSAHARLPACFDQELLDFVAALVKATKVIETEREMSEPESEADDADSIASTDTGDFKLKKASTFRSFGQNLSQDFKGFGKKKTDTDAESIASMESDDVAPDATIKRAGTFKTFSVDLGRDFKNFNANMKTANTHLRDKMKRSTINAMANDRWIAKMVGKITRKLETAKGDFGYSGDLPVSLKPYRDVPDEGTKILA